VELKAGQKLWSTVCDTQVVVVRAPQGDVDLRCGGSPMAAAEGERTGEPGPDWSGGTLLGKRYADEAASLEVLCARAGAGSLSLGSVAIEPKSAKPLPASD
jgi:hypothetical protein